MKSVGGLLLIVGGFLLASAVGALLFLLVGSGLSRLFAVSVWEATAVTLVVAGGVIWVFRGILNPFSWWPYDPVTSLDDEPDDEPAIDIAPTTRRGRRRRR